MGTAGDWVVVFVEFSLEAVSGLRVGAGRRPADSTDAPLLRDPAGLPWIPGSSLKGVLRSAAERFLRARRDDGACDVLSKDKRCLGRVDDPNPKDLEQLCWTCSLFGNPARASRVLVEDLHCETRRTIIRDGIAIDRAELKQAGGLKYEYEVVPPGAGFMGRIRLDDPQPGDIGLVLAMLDLLDQGMVTVGGGASRGLGRVRMRRPPRATRIRASTFVPGVAPEEIDLAAERAAFLERLESPKWT